VIKARGSTTKRSIDLSIDDRAMSVPEGTTILQACQQVGIDVPTLCYAETLTPVNVCRLCVVELAGSRVLVPACSRKVEPGMSIKTDSDRVRLSRRLVLEFLASSVDLSTAPSRVHGYLEHYGAQPERFGPPAPTSPSVQLAAGSVVAHAGHHELGELGFAARIGSPVLLDNELYVRDYAKCILCYKCVEACGADAQNTFAIGVAGRGFDARISTEFATPLPESACVYCGNCIGVCPTGALMPRTEYEMRRAGTWDAAKQTEADTICPYCGVGCTLRLRIQDNSIVTASSPLDHDVTRGHLCIKGRFGWQFVQSGRT
jgi:predicted molibdopterin-dependent oxidoreductase YjgC